MPVDQVVLEKDPYMNKPENYIPGEEITLDATTGSIFALDYGCFFSENLVIRDTVSGDTLRPFIDFTALHLQEAATAEAGREVLSVIRINGSNWAGSYLVDYHAFGGEYSTNAEVLQRLINENEGELETIAWGSIVGKPEQYNPAAHTHDVTEDIKRWNDLVESLDNVRQAIYDGGIPSIDAIFQYIDAVRNGLVGVIDQAVEAHNTASQAHGKSAVGLGSVENKPQATLSSINALNTDYLTPNVFNSMVLKAFSSQPTTMSDPRVSERPIQCITVNLPQVTDGETGQHYNQWLLVQGLMVNNVPQSLVTSNDARWQMVIGLGNNPVDGKERSNRGMMGFRVGSGTNWSAFSNVGKRMLDNVPNYPAAEATPDVLDPDTTVDDQFMTPVVSASLSKNILSESTQTVSILPEGNPSSWVQSGNLEAGKSYIAVVTGFLRDPTAGNDGAVDTVGMAHRVIDSGGQTVGEAAIPAGSLLGLPSGVTNSVLTRAARMQVSATIAFIAPTGTNRRVRFGLDVDLDTGTPRGQVSSVSIMRLK